MEKFKMVVIDAEGLDKMCVAYICSVKGVDFESAVQDFFDDAEIEVDGEEVYRIAKSVFHKGFCNWDNWHFEMLMN